MSIQKLFSTEHLLEAETLLQTTIFDCDKRNELMVDEAGKLENHLRICGLEIKEFIKFRKKYEKEI